MNWYIFIYKKNKETEKQRILNATHTKRVIFRYESYQAIDYIITDN